MQHRRQSGRSSSDKVSGNRAARGSAIPTSENTPLTLDELQPACDNAKNDAHGIAVPSSRQDDAEVDAADLLERRARLQMAIARLSRIALAGGELQPLLNRAVKTVARLFEADYCKVLELLPSADELLLKAGVGWKPGLVGKATVPAGVESQAGFTLSWKRPVLVENFADETRFSGPALLIEHGVVSGMSVIIGEPHNPYGVLGVHSRAPRRFSGADVSFLQAVANVLAQAVKRIAVETELRSITESLEQRIQKRTDLLELQHDISTAANEATSFDAALEYILARVALHNGWQFGHLFLPSPNDPEELVVADTYYTAGPRRFQQFREITRRARFRRGEGLPGRVYETGEAEWAEDLATELVRLRADVCVDLGLKSAAAFPILVRDRAAGVIELFSDKPVEDDPQIRDSMAAVGTHLGRVLEREMAHRDLQESEHRFRAVFENPAVGIVLVERTGSGRILHANQTFARMLGYSAEELHGRGVAEFTHPDDAEHSHGAIDAVLNERLTTVRLEKRYLRKSGEVVWGRLTATMLRDSGGSPIALMGLVWNVTDRKIAEEELREMIVSLDHTTEGIARLGLDGHYITFNPAFARTFGYDVAELEGCHWTQTVHPNDQPVVRRTMQQMSSSGWAECEVRGLRRGGEVFDVHLVMRQGAKESPRGHYCFVNDISRRKALEKQVAELSMREQRRIAKQLHDQLGQQLPVINMMAGGLHRELTARGLPEAARSQRLVESVRLAQMQLRELLRGLMPAQVDPVGLLQALEGLLERYRDGSAATFQFVRDEDIAVKDDFVAANLYSIAEEALQCAARHPDAKQVTLALTSDNGAITLSVRDTGTGLRTLSEGEDETSLRIMQYRAGLMGAQLNIEIDPSAHTTLTCTLEEDTRHANQAAQ